MGMTNGPQLSPEHHPEPAPPPQGLPSLQPSPAEMLLSFSSHFTMDLLTVSEAQQMMLFSFNICFTGGKTQEEAATLSLLF